MVPVPVPKFFTTVEGDDPFMTLYLLLPKDTRTDVDVFHLKGSVILPHPSFISLSTDFTMSERDEDDKFFKRSYL